IILLMRATTVLSTIHQRPSPRCLEEILDPDPNNSFGLIFNTTCFDMMFSGHVSFSVLVALFCNEAPFHLVLRMILGIVAFCSALANIIVGDHYTADVLVAMYISFLVFLLYRSPIAETFQHP